jgi:RNA polymerase sigma-54 factor
MKYFSLIISVSHNPAILSTKMKPSSGVGMKAAVCYNDVSEGAMKLGNVLTIEQTHKLVMTPEMVQAVKILQLSRQELDSLVRSELMDNPVLETESENDGPASEEDMRDTPAESESEREDRVEQQELINAYLEDGELDDISYRQSSGIRDEKPSFEQFTSSEETLREHLMAELQLTEQSSTKKRIGEYIIESLDDNGRMTSSEEEIAQALGTSLSNVRKELEVIRTFEPIGVGAKDLAQCILIQLDYIGEADENYEILLNEHLEDIAANRIKKIADAMSLKKADITYMIEMIRQQNPRPGSEFASGSGTRYIVPDVEIVGEPGDLTVVMNESGGPRLRVSSYYRGVLKNAQADKDEEVVKYLNDRVSSAVQLIKNIDQRRDTINSVTECVVRMQSKFFESGVKYLKPLTMKDVADELGIAVSTVSRAINGKYMQTPKGVFEIRYFFAGGVTDAAGEGISSKSIKTFIKEMIDEEDPAKPLSDQKIADALIKKGMNISRRTVAKYREEIGIASSAKRRRA